MGNQGKKEENFLCFDMEGKRVCQQCKLFDKGVCKLHKIEVCYNDEACREFI